MKACFADPRVLDAALGYYRAASRETLERLTQPALVVGGTRDILPIEAITNSPSAFTGRCDVMVCDGAGHWPHREQAAAIPRPAAVVPRRAAGPGNGAGDAGPRLHGRTAQALE